MKSLTEQLSNYAKYHRDPRNIFTHLFGIPIIVFSVVIIMSRPHLFSIYDVAVTPAVLAAVAAVAYYFALRISFGFIMAVILSVFVVLAAPIAQVSIQSWLGWGFALFLVGWIIQFIGHYYEGKKPAFVDDLVGLIIGPLFVVAEILFGLGLYKNLKLEVEQQAGKVAKQT